MNFDEYSRLDSVAIAKLVRQREVTAKQLAETALAAVERVNGELNAVIETFPDRLEDLQSDRTPEAPLCGVPILNKDLSCAEEGVVMEMGSLLAQGFVPTEDSTFGSRLKSAGLNVLGRTTTPEFGFAGVTESLIAGVTRNPWDLQRSPGGSSGGSAAMIAAGAVPIATGSDGGGSIRGPASHCGIVGLKPTRGRISPGPLRADVAGLSVSFVMTRSLRDSAAVLDAVHGWAPGDPYGVQSPARPYVEELRPPGRQLRIAYTLIPWTSERPVSAAQDGVIKALRLLEESGHSINEARPEFDNDAFVAATLDAWCAHLAVSIDSVGKSLGRTPSRDNLQSTTWACYHYGKQLSMSELMNALDTFSAVSRRVGMFFEKYDALVTPSRMEAAPALNKVNCNPLDTVDAAAWNEMMMRDCAFMPVFNTAGNPAISLPLHENDDGMPLGVQFITRFGDEATLFQLSAMMEEAFPWEGRRPPVHVAK